nr:MAG TPA: hypothetical protein [Caudoviricetes sp.]
MCCRIAKDTGCAKETLCRNWSKQRLCDDTQSRPVLMHLCHHYALMDSQL